MRAAAVALLCCQCAAYELVIGLPHRDPAALEDLFWRVSDPQSPEYLRHRSVADLAQLVGAPQTDIDAATQWLRSLGAADVHVSALRDTVTADIDPSASAALDWGDEAPPLSACPVKADFVLLRGGAAALAQQQQLQQPAVKGLFGPSVSAQKRAYGIPTDLQSSHNSTLQMVWGPGTFGYSKSTLEQQWCQ